MVASVIVGSIVVIWAILTLIYVFVKKAVVEGTLEALAIYDKKTGKVPESMIDLGEMEIKQQKIIKLQEKKAAKEAAKQAKKEAKQAKRKAKKESLEA